MKREQIARAAEIVQQAREKGELLTEIPTACRPSTLGEAYAIQDHLIVLLDEQIVGWFLGCTNREIQQQLGLGDPYSARLLASSLFTSPATLAFPPDLPVVLEVEFAFKLGQSLPRRSPPYSEQEVASAVAAVHPAIEVVIGHFVDWTHQDVYSLIADNGTDGALVVGDGAEQWQDLDLRQIEVSLIVNGEQTREGRGSNVLQGPLSALTWLANHVDRKPGLRQGHIINTGSCTAMYFVNPGDIAVADFGPLGQVTLKLG
ncbi:MAG: fumarylacetoacetate hydrolase family protein [Gammaproteobacteria bacterium]|nr:fumarylacetoacetate hydrolase family protein [Gammaproteobacteria bacterium]